jgi:hypothetical protein
MRPVNLPDRDQVFEIMKARSRQIKGITNPCSEIALGEVHECYLDQEEIVNSNDFEWGE